MGDGLFALGSKLSLITTSVIGDTDFGASMFVWLIARLVSVDALSSNDDAASTGLIV